jgi:phosphatidylethanolamine/phosphatidyl-N-methylethanolamine N-methyltransferase
MPTKLLKSVALFGRELIANPGSTGAAFPSSPFLGKRMASYIAPKTDGWIVELGAGTGSITKALLDHGIAPSKLITIEMSGKLVEHLQKRFPQLNIIQGDAAELRTIVDRVSGTSNTHIDYVVSCLPFRSLPDPLCETIIQQIKQVLGSTGKLIQFTYDLRSKNFHHFREFKRIDSAIVIPNIPPARVDLFEVSSKD